MAYIYSHNKIKLKSKNELIYIYGFIIMIAMYSTLNDFVSKISELISI